MVFVDRTVFFSGWGWGKVHPTPFSHSVVLLEDALVTPKDETCL